MLRLGLLAGSLFLSCTTMAVSATAKENKFVSPELSGWFVASKTPDGGNPVAQLEIPDGETVANATKLVESSVYKGMALLVSPAEAIASAKAKMLTNCPDARFTDLPYEFPEAASTGALRIDCDATQDSGKPRHIFVLVGSDRIALYIKRLTFNQALSAEDVQFAEGYLAATKWCAKDSCP